MKARARRSELKRPASNVVILAFASLAALHGCSRSQQAGLSPEYFDGVQPGRAELAQVDANLEELARLEKLAADINDVRFTEALALTRELLTKRRARTAETAR